VVDLSVGDSLETASQNIYPSAAAVGAADGWGRGERPVSVESVSELSAFSYIVKKPAWQLAQVYENLADLLMPKASNTNLVEFSHSFIYYSGVVAVT